MFLLLPFLTAYIFKALACLFIPLINVGAFATPSQRISMNREKHDCESTMANTEPELNYGCSSWILSSQCASDLYEAGVKLWRKENLVDIEAQLARSFETEYFTVQRIDGVTARIKNPMYRIKNPIWQGLSSINIYT